MDACGLFVGRMTDHSGNNGNVETTPRDLQLPQEIGIIGKQWPDEALAERVADAFVMRRLEVQFLSPAPIFSTGYEKEPLSPDFFPPVLLLSSLSSWASALCASRTVPKLRRPVSDASDPVPLFSDGHFRPTGLGE